MVSLVPRVSLLPTPGKEVVPSIVFFYYCFHSQSAVGHVKSYAYLLVPLCCFTRSKERLVYLFKVGVNVYLLFLPFQLENYRASNVNSMILTGIVKCSSDSVLVFLASLIKRFLKEVEIGAVENVIKNNCKKLTYLINQLSAETTFNIYFLLLLNKTNIDIFDCFSERSDATKACKCTIFSRICRMFCREVCDLTFVIV